MGFLARISVLAALAVPASCSNWIGSGGSESTIARIKRTPWFLRATESQQGPKPGDEDLPHLKSCEAARDNIAARVIADLERDAARQIRWIEEDHWTNVATAPMQEDSESAAGAVPAPASGPSSTVAGNDQVAGVEESDFVKIDGGYIYQLAGGHLQIVASWPAATMRLVGTVALQGAPVQMLLGSDHRLVVFSSDAMGSSPTGAGLDTTSFLPTVQGGRLFAEIFDLTDPEHPDKVATHTISGFYTGARRVGDHIRVVASSSIRTVPGSIWWPTDPEITNNKVRLAQWIEDTLAVNTAKAKATSLAEWLGVDADSAPEFADDCQHLHAPTASVPQGLTRLATFDTKGSPVQQTVLLAAANQVYASADKLYIATPYYWWDGDNQDHDYTFIHRFDDTPDGRSTYVGSGLVDGTTLNQFSLDDHGGFLRVATTITARTGDAWETNSRVTVLALSDGELAEVGRSPDLAPGERIYSARFLGDVGYVVTFKQVDPLFVLDLRDPTAPILSGELKVAGFSAYIHPLDDQLLLTVGRDANPMTGEVGQTKLSLFDVANPAAPREVHSFGLGGDLSTEAQWDHRAFLWNNERQLLALPTSSYGTLPDGSTQSRSGVNFFQVDAEDGIRPFGVLDMSDVGSSSPYPWLGARVSRALFADGIAYAVADAAVRAAAIEDLEHPLATVEYPSIETPPSCDTDPTQL